MIYADNQGLPGSIERYAYYLSCQLTGYLDPVPEGRLSVPQRDALALKLAARWKASEDSGVPSCAWHEIHSWGVEQGTARGACPCARCSGEVRRGGAPVIRPDAQGRVVLTTRDEPASWFDPMDAGETLGAEPS